MLLFLNIVFGGYFRKCYDWKQVLIALIMGVTFGTGWYYIVAGIDKGRYLYYDEMDSNSIKCSKPKNQTYKCTVYKDGVEFGGDLN
jgi:hypothetical protein